MNDACIIEKNLNHQLGSNKYMETFLSIIGGAEKSSTQPISTSIKIIKKKSYIVTQ